MKLSEYKDDEALDLLADILEPAALIMADKELAEMKERGASIAQLVSTAIKTHKEQVMKIMAALDGVPVEEYHCNILTLPSKMIEILNDEELKDFFNSQGQTKGKSKSKSASANTKESGK